VSAAAPVLDRPRLLAGLGLGLTAAAAWIALILVERWAQPGGLGDLAAYCLTPMTPRLADYPGLALMWVLMGAAMMLPTAAPAIDLLARLSRRLETGRARMLAGFTAGYLMAWAGLGLAAAALQLALAMPAGGLPGGAGAGALLVLAGLYQLTPVKQACLRKCRNPLGFFLGAWREGPGGAVVMGLSHGAICIGCCWALMALMLISGAMSVVWMAGLGVAMALEKTAPAAPALGRLIGAAMALAGAALIADSLL